MILLYIYASTEMYGFVNTLRNLNCWELYTQCIYIIYVRGRGQVEEVIRGIGQVACSTTSYHSFLYVYIYVHTLIYSIERTYYYVVLLLIIQYMDHLTCVFSHHSLQIKIKLFSLFSFWLTYLPKLPTL